MKKVIIFGTKENAELANWYFNNDSDIQVVAFTVGKNFLHQTTFCDKPVVEFESLEKKYPPNEYLLFAPLSGKKMNNIRKDIYLQGKNKGYKFATYISTNCINYSKSVGENCFILEGNILQPFTQIGSNVVLWSGNHIGHHTVVHDHVFMCGRVNIAGRCIIEERVFIGANTTMKDGIVAYEGSFISLGSNIIQNIETNSVYAGDFAKKRNIPANRFY